VAIPRFRMWDPVADGSPGAFAQRSSPVPEVLHKRSSINNSIQRTRIPLGIFTSVLNGVICSSWLMTRVIFSDGIDALIARGQTPRILHPKKPSSRSRASETTMREIACSRPSARRCTVATPSRLSLGWLSCPIQNPHCANPGAQFSHAQYDRIK